MHGAIATMTTRKKLKAAKSAAVPARVHDRRATDLPRGSQTADMEVVDPFGDRIIVLRSVRDDPLAAFHARKQIDEAQYLAGRHWQRAYEIAEVGGAQAIDTTKEAVDGGRIPEPFTDAQRRAVGDLSRARKAVGLLGETVLRDVLAFGMTIERITVARGVPGQLSVKFYGRLFRECLDSIAIVFGYASVGSVSEAEEGT